MDCTVPMSAFDFHRVTHRIHEKENYCVACVFYVIIELFSPRSTENICNIASYAALYSGTLIVKGWAKCAPRFAICMGHEHSFFLILLDLRWNLLT